METVHPLKTYRESRNPKLSQEGLAGRLGVTRTTVARWETGTRKIGEEILPTVADETGIPIADLRPDLAKRARMFLADEDAQ